MKESCLEWAIRLYQRLFHCYGQYFFLFSFSFLIFAYSAQILQSEKRHCKYNTIEYTLDWQSMDDEWWQGNVFLILLFLNTQLVLNLIITIRLYLFYNKMGFQFILHGAPKKGSILNLFVYRDADDSSPTLNNANRTLQTTINKRAYLFALLDVQWPFTIVIFEKNNIRHWF